MVSIFRYCLVLALLLATGACLAEESEREGFPEEEWAGLRIANAVGVGPHALKVSINGDLWSEQGFVGGQVSSLRRIKAGRHRLWFVREGIEGHEVRLTLKPGQRVTLVPHVQRSKGSPTLHIKVLKLNAATVASGRVATVVDVGLNGSRLLEIKQLGKSWEPISMRYLELKRFRIIQLRGYLPMRVGRQALNSMPVFEEGHHVVVLYDVPGGGLESLFYRERAWPVPTAPQP